MTDAESAARTYYGRPVLQEPSWHPWVPAYFFFGGLAGGSSLLAAGAEVRGDRRLGAATRTTALLAITAGGVALVADLGRPGRFHHMLRVFRPTSPMNVGSWVLVAYAPAVGVSAASALTGGAGPVGRAATWWAAALAPVVSTYTAVLTADTAVPVWHEARSTMPALFAAGSAASAGGVAAVLLPDASAARRLAIGGAVAEVVAATLQHRSLPDEVADAYRRGTPRVLRLASTASTLGGAALLAAARSSRRRWLARAGGLLVAIGTAATRFAVFEAGKATARDPVATVAPQKRRTAR